MGSNLEEALRAKARAEKQFLERNFVGARNYALKAQKLCPEMEGVSQMVTTFGVYIASEAKINGELDFYSILGLDPHAEKSKIKKQYKKMAAFLHPDKNRTIGADGAFKLVSDAWAVLSDSSKRSLYDQRRYLFTGFGVGSSDHDKFSASSQPKLDTFWTVCTSCHVQYEYLRKYVNKRLSCKNCRDVFIAVETGVAQVTNSFPHSSYTYGHENGYTTHQSGITYTQTVTGYCPPNGHTGHQAGYRDRVSSISFQGYTAGNSSGVVDHNRLSSSFVFSRENEAVNKSKGNQNHHKVKASSDHVVTNGYSSAQNDVAKTRRGRPSKKMKMDFASSLASEENSPKIAANMRVIDEIGAPKPSSKLPSLPMIDVREMLINKARTEIRKKLEEMRSAAERAALEAEKRKSISQADKSNGTSKGTGKSISQADKSNGTTKATGATVAEIKRTLSMPITVPDSDFHDFDKDRSEECFKPKQIWALYDEEDGMPRLYCLIREVISVNPFKIFISYLSSRSDCEFGSVNWLDCGFTKSCGSFRVFHSETVEQVNIFSHLLSREKTGRGGCVKIYPRCGDIWAVYQNWSPEWDSSTPDEVRHQYEMVEVLSDYSDENGVWVAPLMKVAGYKTVYQRNSNTNAVKWIPRKEMLRFSHQVPAYSLKVEGTDLPEGCWDLDTAAIPDKLLGESNVQNITNQREDAIETSPLNEKCPNDQQESEEKNSPTPSDAIALTPNVDTVAKDTNMGDTCFSELLQGEEAALQEDQAINDEAEVAPGMNTRFLFDLNSVEFE